MKTPCRSSISSPSSPRSPRSPRVRGFTLLEIMVTLAIVAIAIIPMLGLREESMLKSYQARNANMARELSRELLSELEFHNLEVLSGEVEGYPGFFYEIEVTLEDLVTGEKDEEEDNKQLGTSDKKNNNNNNEDEGFTSAFTPADAVDPEDAQNQEYPVRRVKLTLTYPNLVDEDKPKEMVIVALLQPLPEDDDGLLTPFTTQQN